MVATSSFGVVVMKAKTSKLTSVAAEDLQQGDFPGKPETQTCGAKTRKGTPCHAGPCAMAGENFMAG